MLMNIPVRCLEGLLVPRVGEQQMRWLTEWIAKLQLLFLCLCGTLPVKHTVVIDRLNSAPWPCAQGILAEGAIALSVTLSGGALFAS